MSAPTRRSSRPVKMTPQEAVECARSLAPRIRERSAEAEALRHMPERTIQDFVETGLVRLLQPLRWEGHELGFDTLVSTAIEIAKACGSSGWCYSVLAIHFWLLSLFPERAQQDVWGRRSDTLIGTALAPAGQPTRADGGFQLSGSWPFASGIDFCEWVILGGLLPPPEPGHPEMRFFLVPKQDYRVDDTWYAAGLRGTGSSNVVLDDVFVPEHRTVAVDGPNPAPCGNASFCGQPVDQHGSSGRRVRIRAETVL